DDSTEHSTGPGMEKAKSVALEHVNGRVTATEFQDEEGYYQIEVTKDDGTQVDVNLDKNFNVISTPSDNERQDGNGAANDGGG
ncbi:MAG: PepSY domain-containing protein, partial [Rubrobacteraceae bacterium]